MKNIIMSSDTSHKTTVNQMVRFLAGVHPTLHMLHAYIDVTLPFTRRQTWNMSVRVLCHFNYTCACGIFSVSPSIPKSGWATRFNSGQIGYAAEKWVEFKTINHTNIIKHPGWILFWENPWILQYSSQATLTNKCE